MPSSAATIHGPEIRRIERVVLVEVDDPSPEPVLDRRRELADDRADHHAVAATLNAENRYGSAAGTRSFQKTDHSRAAYECMSSTAAGRPTATRGPCSR